MNLLPAAEPCTLPLVDIIDLKWLLAAEGIYLHVERLQADPGYARQLIALGECSTSAALRQAACKLRRGLENPL